MVRVWKFGETREKKSTLALLRAFFLTNIMSGAYTPAITNTTNIAASANATAQYSRVGSVVTVSGSVEIDPTTGSAATTFGIALPVASTFTLPGDLAGSNTYDTGRGRAARRGPEGFT